MTRNNPSVVEFFPVPACVHVWKRETFASYGTCTNINVEECEDDQKQTKVAKFICRSDRRCASGQCQLVAKSPTCPLLPPNQYCDLLHEPCLSSVSNVLTKTQTAVRELRHARTRMKVKSLQHLAEGMLSQLSSVAECDSGDGPELYRSVKDVSRDGFGNQVRYLAAISKDVIGKKFHKTAFNYTYTGGCTSFMRFSRPAMMPSMNAFGLLVLPRGHLLSDLYICPVSLHNDQLSLISSDCQMSLTGRIYETNAAEVHDQCWVVCRHSSSCSIIEVNADSDTGVVPSLKTSHCWSDIEVPSSVCLSPYIPAECLVATRTGSVYLWSPDLRPKLIYRETGSSESWHRCHFGSHPRMAVLTDRAGVSLLDFRRTGQKVVDLCTISQPFLHQAERFSMSCRHPKSSFHHFVTTDCSLLMMDERYPKYPVLMWSHNLLSPPQYLDVSCNTFPNSDDDILLVASQKSAEIHCYQFRLNSGRMPQRAPQAVGSHWRISQIEDCQLFTAYEGYGIGSGLLTKRLKAPLSGMCGIPHPSGDGLSVIQVTSFGDTFYQSYGAEVPDPSAPRDKTCSAGVGCNAVSLSDDWLRVVQRWLSEANDQLVAANANRMAAVGKSFLVDTSSVTDDIFKQPSPHPNCPLCRSQPVHGDVKADIDEATGQCPSCRHDIKSSLEILQLYGGEMPSTKMQQNGLLNATDIDPTSELLDERLTRVNVASYTDVESQLLVKLWNDDPDISELLLKRDEECHKKANPEGTENSLEEELEDSSLLSGGQTPDARSPRLKRQRLDSSLSGLSLPFTLGSRGSVTSEKRRLSIDSISTDNDMSKMVKRASDTLNDSVPNSNLMTLLSDLNTNVAGSFW